MAFTKDPALARNIYNGKVPTAAAIQPIGGIKAAGGSSSSGGGGAMIIVLAALAYFAFSR